MAHKIKFAGIQDTTSFVALGVMAVAVFLMYPLTISGPIVGWIVMTVVVLYFLHFLRMSVGRFLISRYVCMNGESTEGEVTDVRARYKSGPRSFPSEAKVSYEFVDKNGAKRKGTLLVAKNEPYKGSKVTVFYDPSRPWMNTIDGLGGWKVLS